MKALSWIKSSSTSFTTFVFLPFFVLVCTVSTNLLFPSSANAASPFDTVLSIGSLPPKAELCGPSSCQTFTSEGMKNTIETFCGTLASQTFDSAVNLGGNYAVSNPEAFSYSFLGYSKLRVIFTNNTIDNTLTFGYIGSVENYSLNVTQNDTWVFDIMRYGEEDYTGSCFEASIGAQLVVAQQYHDRNQSLCLVPIWSQTNTCNTHVLLTSTYNNDFPAGYDGITPYTDPWDILYKPEKPNFHLLSGAGFYMVAEDTNFHTFDPVLFTCEGGTTPVIDFELFRGAESIETGTYSPTVPLQRELVHEAHSYTLEGKYRCDDGVNFFDQTGQLFFALNEYGGVVSGCDESLAGWFCDMQGAFNFGIISSTLNGLNSILYTVKSINPTYCNTSWPSVLGFDNPYYDFNNIAVDVCNNANSFWIDPSSQFNQVNTWLNILLKGAAMMLLVFGILSILGIKIGSLSNPLPSDNNGPAPNQVASNIPTHPSVSRHKTAYVKGKR